MKLLKFIKGWLASQETKKLISLFIAWRIWLVVFALVGVVLLPTRSPHFFGGGLENYSTNPALWGWANFDGEHFLSIAESGYRQFQYFYFPLFPRLVNKLAEVLPFLPDRFLFLGLLVSNLSFLVSIFIFWKLIRIDFKKEVVFFATLALFCFPTSFFLGAFYSEGFFLLLVVTSFYSMRRGNFWLAGAVAALASTTRLTGILLLPAMVVEWFSQRSGRKDSGLVGLFSFLIAPLGLVWYMLFLQDKTGDPFIFYQQISHFGQQRAGEFVLLYQVFWRYIKMIVTVTKSDPIYLTILLEAMVGFGALILIIWGYLKKVRLSYLVFAFLGYILPTLTGSFSSLPRYVLVLFPLFLILGLFLSERGKLFRFIFFSISVMLLAIETALFIRGYWVA